MVRRRLLTTAAVAAVLGVDEAFVYKELQGRRMPATVLAGEWRVRPAELEAWRSLPENARKIERRQESNGRKRRANKGEEVTTRAIDSGTSLPAVTAATAAELEPELAEYITRQEAAAIAGVHVRTVDNWHKASRGTRFYFRYYGRPGGAVRIRRAEFLAYLNSREAEPEEPSE